MASFDGHGGTSMTPPTSPPRGDIPIRNAPGTLSTGKQTEQPKVLNITVPEPSTGVARATVLRATFPSTYPHTSADGVWENPTAYTIVNDSPLGTGLWSSVYLASSGRVGNTSPSPSSTAIDTPPGTPMKHRGHSSSVSSTDSYCTQLSGSTASISTYGVSTAVWAVKTPAHKTAHGVIRSEARILSQIFSHTAPSRYVVPFLGLDPRSGSLLMHALPLTLDDFICGDLASLRESRRTNLLASLFPKLAGALLTGLEWLHEEAGVVHADIKPSNILLRPTKPGLTETMLQQRTLSASSPHKGATLERPSLLMVRATGSHQQTPASNEQNNTHDDDDDYNDIQTIDFEPLYTDFSAALSLRPYPPPSATSTSDHSPPASPITITTTPPLPLAGGTWDFLAPELCRLHPAAPVPTPASDVYALGIAFLVCILGASPFEAPAGGNAFRRREMVRAGDAVGFAGAEARFGAVRRALLSLPAAAGRRKVAGMGMGNGGEGFALEVWLRRGLAKKVEMRAGAREWRSGLEGLV